MTTKNKKQTSGKTSKMPKDVYLSPSAVHRLDVAKLRPALAYDGGDAKRWQSRLRKKLVELLGHMPETRVPLRVRTIWSKKHPLGRIDKIVFTSEPHCDVPAYMCVPDKAEKPYPVMICLQGHSTGMHQSIAVRQDNEDLPFKVEGDRDFALGCMKRGVAALCIEQRSFGERKEKDQKMVSTHGCHDAAMHALLVGKTLAGERVYDVDRGIDYLVARGDIDPKRIGIMGNSGGGTISIYAAAILPRIAFAMPSCSFCSYKDSLMAIYHCADNYIPRILEYAEMNDIAALIAPRPLVIVSGDEDPIFPIAPTRKAFRQIKRVYEAVNAGKNCIHVVCKGGHRFYADDAWKKMLPFVRRET